MTRLSTKIRFGLADLFRKSANLAFVSEWVKSSWLTPTFQRLTDEGFHGNAAVFQCVSTLAFGYNEPPPVVMRKGEPDPKHPLQLLLNRPNPMMSHAELMTYVIIYKAIGGQCYLHKVRGAYRQVAELWPYHAGQVSPVPGPFDWVAEYEFDNGSGEKVKVPASEVIHLKWPSVDLSQPWMALPPLRAVAREVDTDSEMTRYLYALLKNDATPRTLLNVKTTLSDLQFERLRAQFSMRHGGDNRGGVGVVEGDATVTRMSMNLQELAFEALRRVPEARIAGAFRVPAILAGLYVGLEKATYANYKEARAQLTEDTFVPLWKADGIELTQALAPEFAGDPVIEYDLGKVAALQENEDAKYTRILAAYDSKVVTKNEARLYLGLPRVGELQIVDEGDTFINGSMAPGSTGTTEMGAKSDSPILGYHIDAGVVSRNEARAQLGLEPEDPTQSDKIRDLKESLGVLQMAVNVGFPLDIALDLIGMDVSLPEPEPRTIDALVSPPLLTDEQKRYPYPLALKAKRQDSTRTVRERMQEELERALQAQYEEAIPSG